MPSEKSKNIISGALLAVFIFYLALNVFPGILPWLGRRVKPVPAGKLSAVLQDWRDFASGKPRAILRLRAAAGKGVVFPLIEPCENLDADGNELYVLPVTAADLDYWKQRNSVSAGEQNSFADLPLGERQGYRFLALPGKIIFLASADYPGELADIVRRFALARRGVVSYPRGLIQGPVAISGFGESEGPYPQFDLPRITWGYGPVSRIDLAGCRAGKVELQLSVRTTLPGQVLDIYQDSILIEKIPVPVTSRLIPLAAELVLRKGKNAIAFSYAQWNHGQGGDPRPMAVLFAHILIREDR